jgi:hypothetical protein
VGRLNKWTIVAYFKPFFWYLLSAYRISACEVRGNMLTSLFCSMDHARHFLLTGHTVLNTHSRHLLLTGHTVLNTHSRHLLLTGHTVLNTYFHYPRVSVSSFHSYQTMVFNILSCCHTPYITAFTLVWFNSNQFLYTLIMFILFQF